jgi:transposase
LRTDALIPEPENATEAEVLVAMEAAPNKRSYRRLAAIRALLLGHTRAQVSVLFGRSERMVRLWILQFNAGGIDALASKPQTGRPRRVKLKRVEDLLVPVLEDPSLAGQVHWTGVKVHGFLQEELQTELGYRTVIRYLHELNYNLRVPQCWPERQNQEDRAKFLEDLQSLRESDPSVEIWYGDESGIEGDPRPRRRWTVRGGRPRVPYQGDHIRTNIIGSVCPATGESFALLFSGVDCPGRGLCIVASGFRLETLTRHAVRRLPVLPRPPRRSRASRPCQTAHPHPRQRILAQISPAPLASLRSALPARIQP